MRRVFFALILATTALAAPASAQDWFEDINIFGYFQTQFLERNDLSNDERDNSFNLQQLNLLLQRDIGPRWSAFINFEMVNSYSSARGFGSFSLEEAWLGYRRDYRLRIRMGLLIPRFNRLNEFKNKMPSIPYVMRPLVYESSLEGDVRIEEFVPQRAYLQADGFLRAGSTKLDYALWFGNTNQINTDPAFGQTGVDTTDQISVGARLGVRLGDFSLGISGTGEEIDAFAVVRDTSGLAVTRLDDIPFGRMGVDLAFEIWKLTFEAEAIGVFYDVGDRDVDLNKGFGYGTLGYHYSDDWFIYATLWILDQRLGVFDTDAVIGSFGLANQVNERITLKLQVGSGEIDNTSPSGNNQNDFEFATLAASVFF